MAGNAQDLLLVAEDSDEDFEILEYLMQELEVQNPIHRCEDGSEILEFLQQGQRPNAALSAQPAVILLDLNLPGIDGRQVLSHLKQTESLQKIPVVVLTTSMNPSDIDFCYRQGANGYLVKPMEMDDLETTIRAFIRFWLEVNTSPHGVRSAEPAEFDE